MNRFYWSALPLYLSLCLPAFAQKPLKNLEDKAPVAAPVRGQNAQADDKPQLSVKQIDLDYAVSSGSVERVRDVLDRGEHTITPAQRRGMLMQAVAGNNLDIVNLLLDRGASISEESYGLTPLMLAANQGRMPVVKLLLDRGANINAKDSSGRTALSCCVWNIDCMKYLLHLGARPMRADFNNALVIAVRESNAAGVAFLLNKGADPNTRGTIRCCALGRKTKLVFTVRGPLLLAEEKQSLVNAKHAQNANEVRADRQIIQLLQRAGARE